MFLKNATEVKCASSKVPLCILGVGVVREHSPMDANVASSLKRLLQSVPADPLQEGEREVVWAYFSFIETLHVLHLEKYSSVQDKHSHRSQNMLSFHLSSVSSLLIKT